MYPRGGDCVVTLQTADLLREKGHEVRLYAMDFPDNLPLPDCSGYASQVSFDGGLGDKLKAVKRLMGKGDIKASFSKVMDDFKPDVVHLHNIHSYLSPVIGEIAAAKGARVVWTQHDFKLICPAYSCRRPDGTNCEECFGGYLAVTRHKCMKGSTTASFVAKQEAKHWNLKRLQKFTSSFICPSGFMAERLSRSGVAKEYLKVLSNFANPEKYVGYDVNETPEDYFCYVGRLSSEKGVATLLKAVRLAGVKLKVAGTGPMEEELKNMYADVPDIEFLGQLDSAGVARLLRDAAASVMPSECYENNPLGVIESLCLGAPVIGAEIGGVPELIRDDADGLRRGVTFPSRDATALAEILRHFNPAEFNRSEIAQRARDTYSADRHYEQLMKIYSPD